MIEVTGCGVELSLRRQSISGRCSDGEGSWLNFLLFVHQFVFVFVFGFVFDFVFAVYHWQLLGW